MQDILPILLETPLFAGIGPEDLSGMLICLGARKQVFQKGSSIFTEGDEAVSMGLVVTGSVLLVRDDIYGNRSILARIGPKQLFGESYAFSREKRLPVSVVAEQEASVLIFDSRRLTSCCHNACAFHNQMIYNLLTMVATKNLLLHQKIQITARRTTREKLMAYLLLLAKEQGSREVTVPYDRQGLADYLEVDRSGLSSEIGKLKKEGILESKKNTFRLLS